MALSVQCSSSCVPLQLHFECMGHHWDCSNLPQHLNEVIGLINISRDINYTEWQWINNKPFWV